MMQVEDVKSATLFQGACKYGRHGIVHRKLKVIFCGCLKDGELLAPIVILRYFSYDASLQNPVGFRNTV